MIRSRKPKKSGGKTPLTYAVVRGRQILALSVTVWSLIFLAVLSRRPDLFGGFDKSRAFLLQVLVIAAFACFTAWNWRCPACGRYLGADFAKKRTCRKCGTALRS